MEPHASGDSSGNALPPTRPVFPPRLETVFAGALEIDPGLRDDWVRRQCAGDAFLLEEVRELLASADLEAAEPRPAPQGAGFAAEAQTGSSVGPYRLERVLGSGGMGTVYLARREGEVDQTVAIKIIPPGAGSEQFLRYFREERQILASLSHPNVTRFLDAGSGPDGAPYLVMEYVDGEPLHAHQDRRSLDIEARLDLFRKICGAVSFLHANLILHRDLKPSNILVTAAGEPKLLDFGAAKALEHADRTVTMAPLTPRYASPEQALGKRVTTRSDVYALGVILYESLTGAWPFGDPNSVAASMGRFLGNVAVADPATAVTEEAAKVRSATIADLRSALTGDLDRIVRKALASEADERYESVAALSEDVRRYLAHEPVLARPQTAGYRLRKFARRHRAAVAAGVVFAVSIGAASGVALWQAREARAARARAEQRFDDVRKLTRLVLFDFHDEVAKLPGGMELQQKLIQRTLGQFETLAEQAKGDPEILAEAGEGYRRLASLMGNQYSNNAGDTAGAIATYRKGIALLDGKTRGTGAELALARLRRDLGRVLGTRGDAKGGLAELELAASGLESVLRVSPSLETEMELMQARNSIGDIVFDYDPKRALAMYDAAVPVLEKARRADPNQASNGILHYKRGACQELLGNLPAALEHYRQGLAENSRLPAKLAALTANRRARASILSVLGSGLAALGGGAEAGPYLDESVAIARSIAAADPGSVRALYSLAANLNNRNAALRQIGTPERLHASLLEEEAVWSAIVARSPISLYLSGAGANLDAVSQSFAQRGDLAGARRNAARGLALLQKVVDGKPNPEDRRRYAALLLEGGAPELRNPKLALEQTEAAMKDTANPSAALSRAHGLALLRAGRPADAIAPLEKAIAALTPKNGARDPHDLAATRKWLEEAKTAARR